MPSPLTHAAMGYAIYRLRRAHAPDIDSLKPRQMPRLLLITIGLSVLPDVDVVPGLLAGDLGRFHNHISNSVFVGLLVAFVFASLAWARYRSSFTFWFTTAALCYELHILMDLLTPGRGLMLLWPFTSDRYDLPLKLFYGVHWSQGWLTFHHVVTLATEFLTIGGVLLSVRTIRRIRGGFSSLVNG